MICVTGHPELFECFLDEWACIDNFSLAVLVDTKDEHVLGLAVAWNVTDAYFVSFQDCSSESGGDEDQKKHEGQKKMGAQRCGNVENVIERVKAVFTRRQSSPSDSARTIICYHSRSVMKGLHRIGIAARGNFIDLSVANWLINPDSPIPKDVASLAAMFLQSLELKSFLPRAKLSAEGDGEREACFEAVLCWGTSKPLLKR